MLSEFSSRQFVYEYANTVSLKVMVSVFTRDGFDYFTDMMPALHNYVTVDTKAFLANPQYMEAMFNMAKAMLEVNMVDR